MVLLMVLVFFIPLSGAPWAFNNTGEAEHPGLPGEACPLVTAWLSDNFLSACNYTHRSPFPLPAPDQKKKRAVLNDIHPQIIG